MDLLYVGQAQLMAKVVAALVGAEVCVGWKQRPAVFTRRLQPVSAWHELELDISTSSIVNRAKSFQNNILLHFPHNLKQRTIRPFASI